MVDYSKSRNLTPAQAAEMAERIKQRQAGSTWANMLNPGPAKRDTGMFEQMLQNMDPAAAANFGGAGHLKSSLELANMLNPRPSRPGLMHLLHDISGNTMEAFGGGDQGPGFFDQPFAGNAGADQARNAMFLQLLGHKPKPATGTSTGTMGAGIPGLPAWISNLPSKEAGERRNKQLAIYDWMASNNQPLSPAQVNHAKNLMQEEAGMSFQDITGDDWKTTERTIKETNPLGSRFSPQFLEQVGDYGADTVVSTKEIPPTEGMMKRASTRRAGQQSTKFLDELLAGYEGIDDLPNMNIFFNERGIANLTPIGKAIDHYGVAVEGYVRAMSGAEVPEAEIKRLAGYFTPKATDTVDQARFRLELMKDYLKTSELLDDRDPTTNPESVEDFLERVGAPAWLTEETDRLEQERLENEHVERVERGEFNFDEEGNPIPVPEGENDAATEGTGDQSSLFNTMLGINPAYAADHYDGDTGLLGDMANMGASMVSPETPFNDGRDIISQMAAGGPVSFMSPETPYSNPWRDLGDGIMMRPLSPHQFAKSPTFEDMGYADMGGGVWGQDLAPLDQPTDPVMTSDQARRELQREKARQDLINLMSGSPAALMSPNEMPGQRDFFSNMADGGASMVSPEAPPSQFFSDMANGGASMASPETPPSQFVSVATGGAPSIVSPETPPGAPATDSQRTKIRDAVARARARRARRTAPAPQFFEDTSIRATPDSPAVTAMKQRDKRVFQRLRDSIGEAGTTEDMLAIAKMLNYVQNDMTLEEFKAVLKEWGIKE